MSTAADRKGTAAGEVRLIEVRPPRGGAERSPAPAGGAWVVAVILALAVVVPTLAIQLRKAELLGDLERRLGILARGRAEVTEAWLDGLSRPVQRLVESEMVRLFAAEVDLSRADLSELTADGGEPTGGAGQTSGLGVPLAAQIPFMEQVLTDFTRSAGFAAGYLVDRDGVARIASAGAPEPSPEQRELAARSLDGGAVTFGPARASPVGLVVDMAAPILPAQSGSGGEPVGVALLSAPVALMLSEVLSPAPLAEPGERLRLLQLGEDGAFSEIVPGLVPPVRPAGRFEPSGPERTIAFAERPGIGADAAVYSVGAPVAGPPWWVVQEIDAQAAGRRLHGFMAAVIAVAVLVVVTVAAAFGAFWWRLANEHSAALADQFRRLAARIEAQKRLLDSINNTITDYIGLKGLEGAYRYVNPAFARAMGRDVDQAVGLDDAAIFGEPTAERLKHSDRRALASDAPVTVNEAVQLNARRRHLQLTKVPYRDDQGALAGLVTVARDVTELVEAQQRRERSLQQTVAALVRAIELRDPYLAGHSRRLAGFAVAVAERLGADPNEAATVAIAASLSQIGKLGVPRRILTKPKRLSPPEIAQVRRHVNHAAKILRGIDFGLPVLQTIRQMHERLDGGGYPKGLAGRQIRLSARILGACDVFCARIAPRAYRQGIPAQVALEILEQNRHRYDPKVVAALREVVDSEIGRRLMAGLGTARAAPPAAPRARPGPRARHGQAV